MATRDGHPYGEPRDYYCPHCDFRETRHWPPPAIFCPECGKGFIRRDPFRYGESREGK